LSVIFSALLFFFEIRRALNGGDPYANNFGLIEQRLFATTSLGFSLALRRLDTMRASRVFRFASFAPGWDWRSRPQIDHRCGGRCQ
jgi:hypothetical protein